MDTRTLLRSVYDNDADFIPDDKEKTLRVRLHHIANHAESAALQQLCAQLNETKTIFPGTTYRLVYELGSPKIPRNQEPCSWYEKGGLN